MSRAYPPRGDEVQLMNDMRYPVSEWSNDR
jgi:hypothetical protein